MVSAKRILLILAFLCFVLVVFGVATSVNLIALGLALWVLTFII